MPNTVFIVVRLKPLMFVNTDLLMEKRLSIKFKIFGTVLILLQ